MEQLQSCVVSKFIQFVSIFTLFNKERPLIDFERFKALFDFLKVEDKPKETQD
jgi:hypothetical protein